MSEIKNICVFCGSSSGARPEYLAAATALGSEIARRNMNLVYGGARIGLMGAVADAVIVNGGSVTGVIPKTFQNEVAHERLTELHVVDNMHVRKAMMYEKADAFIALPGGLGTLDEFFETLTWSQLGFHKKPCALLNVCGYYDKIIEFIEHSVNEKFVRRAHKDIIIIESSPEKIIDRLILL
jgi:uncharacterized protein (TIGR00730 family)